MKNSSCEKSKIAGRAWYIERPREGQRLAGIDRFRARKFVEVPLDQIGDAKQQPRSLGGVRSRPVGESFLRSRHRQLDVTAVAVRHLGIGFAGRGLNIVEVFAPNRSG